MLCYAIPTSHLPAHAFSSSPRVRHAPPSSYHCGPSSYLAPNDDDDEESYYEYLDAVRRQRERRELEQVQAERWARQEAARVQRAEQEARRAAFIEYQEYLQQQHQERLRAQAVAQARAQAVAHAKAKAQAIAQARARAIAQYQAREHARAVEAQKLQQQQQQEQEQALRRQIMDHIVRSVVAAANTPDTPSPTQTRPAVTAPPAPQQAPKPAFATKVSFASHVHVAQPQSDEEAAIRQRLQQVQAIQARLDDARKAFVEPETLVFDSSATSSSPKLAYSPLNRPVQVLEETLTKLLIDLDTITSDGHQQVKTARKQLAVAIEEALTKLESIKSALWNKQDKSVQEADSTPEQASAAAKPDEAAKVDVEDKSLEVAVPASPAHEAEDNAIKAAEQSEEAAQTSLTEEPAKEAAPVVQNSEPEKTSSIAVDKAAAPADDAIQEPLPSTPKEKATSVEAAAIPVIEATQHTSSETEEEQKAEVDSSVAGGFQEDVSIETSSTAQVADTPQSAPASAALVASDSPSPSHVHDSSTDQTEQAEHIEVVEQPTSASEGTAAPSQPPSQDAPKSPSLSVTVTDDEDEEPQAESAAYQDISKAFHAEIEPSQEELESDNKPSEDASSESSFEML